MSNKDKSGEWLTDFIISAAIAAVFTICFFKTFF